MLAQRVRQTFAREFGKENVLEPRGEMVSEDFGLFGLENRSIPTLMFRLGATDPERMKQSRQTGTPLPSSIPASLPRWRPPFAPESSPPQARFWI